jgi:hypothetical protein
VIEDIDQFAGVTTSLAEAKYSLRHSIGGLNDKS